MQAILGLCGLVASLLVLSLFLSFSQLAPTEIALKYNYLTQTVAEESADMPGLYFLGPFTRFLRFPNTVQTIHLDKEHSDMLDTRTSDGLHLFLEVTFYWRLNRGSIHKLYSEYDMAYTKIFERMGTHLIGEHATKHSAYDFFNDRRTIAREMNDYLNKYFEKHLYASISNLQIDEDKLPEEFHDMVVQAGSIAQNISAMQKQKEANSISYYTLVLTAEAAANQTIQKAHGEAAAILQEAGANAAQITYYTDAEKHAYGHVQEALKLKGDALLDYIWYDAMGGGGVTASGGKPVDKTILVGVNPAAYISGQ